MFEENWNNWYHCSQTSFYFYLAKLLPLKRALITYVPLKSLYKVVFPSVISQGNNIFVKSNTADIPLGIPLGCPALGVSVKPEGKSLQKERSG